MSRLLRVRFARYNLHALIGPPAGGRKFFQPESLDVAHGGLLSITGTVTVNAVAAQKRVLLLDRKNGQVVRSCVSAPNGGYAFTGLCAGKYCVLGFDDGLNFNARVADNIEPE